MNGLTLDAHVDLKEANTADAILIGSGMKTREVANNSSILSQLHLNPVKQLIAAQCSGTFLLAKLGLIGQTPACTDLTSKPWVQAAGVNVLNQAFFAHGNLATAGGCLSAQYIAAWMIARLKGVAEAKEARHYFAPVGEKEGYVARALSHIKANLLEQSGALQTSGA